MKFSSTVVTSFIVLVYVLFTSTEAKPQHKSFEHTSEVEQNQLSNHSVDQVESRQAMLNFLNSLTTMTPTRYEPENSNRRIQTHSKRSVRSDLKNIVKKDLEGVAKKKSKRSFKSMFSFSLHHLF